MRKLKSHTVALIACGLAVCGMRFLIAAMAIGAGFKKWRQELPALGAEHG